VLQAKQIERDARSAQDSLARIEHKQMYVALGSLFIANNRPGMSGVLDRQSSFECDCSVEEEVPTCRMRGYLSDRLTFSTFDCISTSKAFAAGGSLGDCNVMPSFFV